MLVGPFAHCFVLVLIIVFFRRVPEFTQPLYAVLIPISNLIFLRLTLSGVAAVNPDCARACSQFHSCIGGILRMSMFGAAKSIVTFFILVFADLCLNVFQGFLSSAALSKACFPDDPKRQISRQYDMALVMAIDYLNNTAGIMVWLSIFAVIYHGPNSEPSRFIEMGFDYQQAAIWSALSWVLVTLTFLYVAHVKKYEHEAVDEGMGSNLQSNRAVAKLGFVDEDGSINLNDDSVCDDGRRQHHSFFDYKIDLLAFLMYLYNDPSCRTIIRGNIYAAVAFSFFWMVEHNGMAPVIGALEHAQDDLRVFEERLLDKFSGD
jgi:hypothetical protein